MKQALYKQNEIEKKNCSVFNNVWRKLNALRQLTFFNVKIEKFKLWMEIFLISVLGGGI